MSDEMKKLITTAQTELKADIAAIRADVGSVRTELKADIAAVRAELKDEIGSLRTEFKAELKSEITGVWTELGRVNERLDGHDAWLRGITTEQARARGDIEWLKENMVSRGEFKSGMSQIMGRFDGFASLFDEFRLRWAVQSDTLAQHHQRLSALEQKRA